MKEESYKGGKLVGWEEVVLPFVPLARTEIYRVSFDLRNVDKQFSQNR